MMAAAILAIIKAAVSLFLSVLPSASAAVHFATWPTTTFPLIEYSP
jgi:hypothetical protein